MSLLIDDSAKKRLEELHKEDKSSNRILLIDLNQSGCSGWAYHYSWLVSQEASKKKLIVEEIEMNGHHFSVGYPEMYADYFKGATLIYKQEALNTRLVIDNPNVMSECGCGESVNFQQ